MEGALKRFTLELDCHADPIAGRLVDEGGERRSFAGWLGLAAALEHFTSAEDDDTNRAGSPLAK